MTIQKKATIISSLVASLLICVKFIVGILSGSVAILASAIDSLLDLCISLFNLYAITKSEQPANSSFNYGKGKIESLAAVIEGSIISASGAFILYESFKKLILGSELNYLTYSVWVMVFSIIITTLLVLYLNFVAKKSNNLVIKSDALHYKTDILSNLSVLVALVMIYFTGFNELDALFGIGIGIYIIYSAWTLLKSGVLILLDRALDANIIQSIEKILNSAPINSYHDLKTRQSGETYFLEVHLVFNAEISLLEAHDIADSIEKQIKALEGSWIVITHLDPEDDEGR